MQDIPENHHTSYIKTGGDQWYPPIIVSINQIGDMALSSFCLDKVMKIVDKLEQDDYTLFVKEFCQSGKERFNKKWQYADITTALYAAAHFTKPRNYLEIGVRRGRSMAIVAATNPDCQIVAFDLWTSMYANISNPGPEFVSKEMKKIGYQGNIEFISGNSHKTLPAYLKNYPELFFDLVTVDGDHSENGARKDLLTILPRIKVGGVIVFDDISHPSLPHLRKVWNDVVVNNFHFSSWEFKDLGFGVAMAIRRAF